MRLSFELDTDVIQRVIERAHPEPEAADPVEDDEEDDEDWE